MTAPLTLRMTPAGHLLAEATAEAPALPLEILVPIKNVLRMEDKIVAVRLWDFLDNQIS